MDNLEFKTTVYKINLDGKQYEMRKPKAFEVLKFQKSIKDSQDEESQFTRLVEFFTSLGLAKEATESMELDHILELANKVSGSDKKK